VLFRSEDDIGVTNPYHPRACYIEGKRCGEAIVNGFRSEGIDAKSVRLSLAYGEGTKADDQRAMSVFIRKGLTGGRIDLLDRGTDMRSYCYVGDAVNMMLRVLTEGKAAVYNIGGRSLVSIADLVYKIGDYLDVPVILPQEEKKIAGSPLIVRMSISRYEWEFGRREFVSLEDGLKLTIEYNRKLYRCE